MTNTMTISKAVQIAKSPEALQVLDAVQLQGLVDVLTTSSDKKVTRLIDMVKGVIAGRKKEAPKQEQMELAEVENSIKSKIRKPNKKAQATATAKAEEATKPAKTAPKKIVPNAKAKQNATASKQQPAKSEAKKDVFPMETPDGNFKRIEFKDIKEMQKQLVENPYTLHLFMLEPGYTELTIFLVTYVNDGVMVLVDRSVQVNSVVPIDMKTYKNGTVKFDGKQVPVGFYVPNNK